jgi:hypothetical protein
MSVHAPCYREYYVTVDSANRDRTIWTSTSQYEVKMQPSSGFQGATIDRAFKNVYSVEVINAIFPNQNNVLDEMYLYLCVPELNGLYESTNDVGNKALAQLVPDKVIGSFVYSVYDTEKHPRRYFPVEGARIDRMTIEFRKRDGALFNFGADTGSGSPVLPLLQTSVTFRVVVRDKIIP